MSQGADRAVGLLLAAGAGRRMGQPKALMRDERGPWLLRAVEALGAGGCDAVYVVLGAAVVGPRELLREEHLTDRAEEVYVVVAEDWAQGQSASLRAGLDAVSDDAQATACVVTLVDLPDLGPAVVARCLAEGAGRDTLRRASYHGEPGHPVVLGRDHWAAVREQTEGDQGARGYLGAHAAQTVECGDLASGRDVDRPE